MTISKRKPTLVNVNKLAIQVIYRRYSQTQRRALFGQGHVIGSPIVRTSAELAPQEFLNGIAEQKNFLTDSTIPTPTRIGGSCCASELSQRMPLPPSPEKSVAKDHQPGGYQGPTVPEVKGI